MLGVVASLVVHCCGIKKNVIIASQLYNVTDVQFRVESRLEWTECKVDLA